MTTLLQKALTSPPRRNKKTGRYDTSEVMELAIAWAEDKVTFTQVSTGLGYKSSGTPAYGALAMGLRRAMREGKIKKV